MFFNFSYFFCFVCRWGSRHLSTAPPAPPFYYQIFLEAIPPSPSLSYLRFRFFSTPLLFLTEEWLSHTRFSSNKSAETLPSSRHQATTRAALIHLHTGPVQCFNLLHISPCLSFLSSQKAHLMALRSLVTLFDQVDFKHFFSPPLSPSPPFSVPMFNSIFFLLGPCFPASSSHYQPNKINVFYFTLTYAIAILSSHSNTLSCGCLNTHPQTQDGMHSVLSYTSLW